MNYKSSLLSSCLPLCLFLLVHDFEMGTAMYVEMRSVAWILIDILRELECGIPQATWSPISKF